MPKRARRQSAQNLRSAAVHPQDVAALNRGFFATDPADYFQRRLNQGVRLFSKSDAELRMHPEAFQIGELRGTVPSVADEPADERAHEAFALIEAEMMLHHLVETVLRMFLAHQAQPPSPWIAVSDLRGPGELKRQLKRQILHPRDGDGLRSNVGWVFLGHREPPATWDGERTAKWREAVGNIHGYLEHFANLFLDRGAAYNAAKHGLTTQVGQSAISLQGVPELDQDGPAFAYLGTQIEDGVAHVAVLNQWVDTTQNLSLSVVGVGLLRNLWLLARMRYVDWPVPKGGLELFLPPASVGELLRIAAGKPEQGAWFDVGAVTFPPTFFSPPGAGTDALIAQAQKRSEEA